MTAEQLRLEVTGSASRVRRTPRKSPALAVPRVALSVEEAAAALGISRDHLERHVLHELRVIYSGRRRLIPVVELQRWAERQAVAPVVARVQRSRTA